MKIKNIKLPNLKNVFRQRISAFACGAASFSWKKVPLRSKIYGFVILISLFISFSTPSANAFIDSFGFGIHDLYANITKNIGETNDILEQAFHFTTTSPYDIINGFAAPQSTVLINLRAATISMALVVATLLLMVEFFRKTINFEWSSKWENILIFLVKIIVIKQVVQNADVIVGYIYAGFNTINEAVSGGVAEFLPCGDQATYIISEESFADRIRNIVNLFNRDYVPAGEIHSYRISKEAVYLFYPTARFPGTPYVGPATRWHGSFDIGVSPFSSPMSHANFNATVEMILSQPYFLVLKAIAIMVFVIAICRVFELAVYTIFAPLPIATFASDVTNDAGKSFIKNYIAVVLQIAVIVAMFMVYVGFQSYLASNYSSHLINAVALIALGLGVIKSGAWARKVCGVG